MNKNQAYKILELGVDADDKSIKKSYRRLAIQYHPDTSSDSNSYQKFIEISEAYEFLSVKTTVRKKTKKYSTSQTQKDFKFRNKDFSHNDYVNSSNNYADWRGEREERARQRYYEEFENDKKIFQQEFDKYKNSFQRKLVILMAFIGVALSIIYIYDYYAIPINVPVEVNVIDKEPSILIDYNMGYVLKYQDRKYELDKRGFYYIQKWFDLELKNEILFIEKSSLLHNRGDLLILIEQEDEFISYKSILPTVSSSIIIILLLLLFPAFSFLFEGPSFNFVLFAVNYNLYGFPFFVIVLIVNMMPVLWN